MWRAPPAFPLQRPPARHSALRPVAFRVDEFAFPTACTEQPRSDFFEGLGEDRPQQLMSVLAGRLLSRPPVQLFRAVIPIGDEVVHAPHENHIVRQVAEAGLFAQPEFRRLALPGKKTGRRDRRDGDWQVVDDSFGL